ncbi:RNA polymerase sigma factor [uncultured Clostridium sp.]|uniref:RNA polymerase sigma factor n=1 Tax=uncultured Clostridium sp. TaxID=59620 RepID=UPI00261C98BD|nr:RNA polymerase sigma factor [uncultured Clostridium sp.]
MDEFSTLYKLNKDTIYIYFLYKTKDDYIAQELLAQTFFLAYKSLNSFKGNSKFSTWLMGISKNVFKDYLRKEKKFDTVPLENVESYLSYDSNLDKKLIENEELLSLFKAIDSLDEDFREIIMLRAVCNMSNLEIAQLLDKKETYIRVKFHRGKVKLKEILKERV